MPVDYEINGESYQGYFVSASADAPLVLLIHDWTGLTDYEVERAEMIAEMGYSVFAADLFGTDIRPTRVADKRQYTGELYKDRDKMRALLTGALEKTASLGGNTKNAVAMGYGFGGAVVLELARSGTDLKGEDTNRKSWERFSQFLGQAVDSPIESVVVPAEPGVDIALEPVVDSGSEKMPHATE